MLHVWFAAMLCDWEMCVKRKKKSHVSYVNASHLVAHIHAICYAYGMLLCCDWVMCAKVMSHMRMSLVAHIHGSCYPYEWVIFYMWMNLLASNSKTKTEKKGKVAYVYKSCRAYPYMGYVTRTNESFLTFEWVGEKASPTQTKKKNEQSHMCTSLVAHIHGLCYTYEWVIS